MKIEDYPTTHQIARKLLDMPEALMIIATPVPGTGNAIASPVALDIITVAGRQCVAVTPLPDVPLAPLPDMPIELKPAADEVRPD